jgi:hypothetical protein
MQLLCVRSPQRERMMNSSIGRIFRFFTLLASIRVCRQRLPFTYIFVDTLLE